MADAAIQKVFLYQCIETLFKTVNELEKVFYNLSNADTDALLKSAGFSEVSEGQLMCKRDQFVPRLLIRPASVEDCDQLLSLFRNNQMGDLILNDYDISKFIECSSLSDPSPVAETTKALVAESKGRIVGFIRTSNRVPITKIAQRYHVEIFTSVGTIGRRVLKSIEHLSSLRELDSVDQVGLQVTEGVSVMGLNDIEALKQDNLEEVTVKEKVGAQTPKVGHRRPGKHGGGGKEAITREFTIITHFCIDSNYVKQAKEFLPVISRCFGK